MAVEVVCVGRLVCDANGEEGDHGGESGETLFVSCLFERFGHSEWVRRRYGLTSGDYTLATLEKQRWGERGTRGLFQRRRRDEGEAARFAVESADLDFFEKQRRGDD